MHLNYDDDNDVPCFEAAFSPDVDKVVLDGDAINAGAHPREEGEPRAQVH